MTENQSIAFFDEQLAILNQRLAINEALLIARQCRNNMSSASSVRGCRASTASMPLVIGFLVIGRPSLPGVNDAHGRT